MPSEHRQLIHLHRRAPPKPAVGAACNGCGVCCAAEPCPVGMLVFRQRRGPCPALRWHEDGNASRYRCGLLTATGEYLRWLPVRWHARAARFLARRIAAGAGCDSDAHCD